MSVPDNFILTCLHRSVLLGWLLTLSCFEGESLFTHLQDPLECLGQNLISWQERAPHSHLYRVLSWVSPSHTEWSSGILAKGALSGYKEEQDEKAPGLPCSTWSSDLAMSDVWSHLSEAGSLAVWQKGSHGVPAQIYNSQSPAHSVLLGTVESAPDSVA